MKAAGKFIDSSGLPKIIVDSGLLAEGSLRGFLSGTHFNRCKKIHPVVSMSLKISHFKRFLKTYNEKTHEGKLQLDELQQIIINDENNFETTDRTLPQLMDVLEQYNSFYKETIKGDHGCTAQFALMYVDLIDQFYHLERSIRTSDVTLYNHATHQMCALFFAFNHQNYARWLCRNYDNFVNIQETHPGLLEEFESGALSVRRTEKHFCRSPIDLTLEQTINADAANKLTGITAFTNNLNARQKWSETHTIRTSLISNFFEMVDLTKFSESSENIYYSRIFTKQVKQFQEELDKNINPFSDEINTKKLFNVSTGKAASEAAMKFLLNVTSTGERQRDTFIEECRLDSKRFDRPIKRNTIKNFAAENASIKKSSVNQIDETKIERNILGQVLFLAIDKQIDLQSVFSYPLTTVPHSLANLDGSMISSGQKGELISLFISRIDKREILPDKFDVEIIDGFDFLRALRSSPMKYGQFATFLLTQLCDTDAQEIHILFEKDDGQSIKDVNIKKKVYEDCTQFEIIGPNQERIGSLAKCLNNVNFQTELVGFLINYWANHEISGTILGEKRLFLSYGKQCYLYSNDYEKKKPVSNFESNHIEIETKIVMHLYKIAAKNILIKISNADSLFVYLLFHMQHWTTAREVWIKSATEIINVNQIFKLFSWQFINALPAWHVFSGCNYEPSFYRKGKKSCLKLLEKRMEYQLAFGALGDHSDVSEGTISTLEEFTCHLYNTNEKSVNKARQKIFENSYRVKMSTGKLIDFGKNGKSGFL